MGHIVLGIDPGLYTGLGIIKVDDDRNIVMSKRMTLQWKEELLEFLNNFPAPKNNDFTVVLEDFALREAKARDVAKNVYSRKMEVCRVIGAVELWCYREGHKLVMTDPGRNPMNAKHSGVAIPKHHRSSDEVIAYNHAYAHLLDLRLIRHRMHNEV